MTEYESAVLRDERTRLVPGRLGEFSAATLRSLEYVLGSASEPEETGIAMRRSRVTATFSRWWSRADSTEVGGFRPSPG